MTDFFNMLSTISRRRKADGSSPFASVKTTEKWLKSLPSDSDYDAHHALVEGLEHFNAGNEVATLSRMKSLMKLEAAGLPLQHCIVDQYVRNQSSFRLARQALWRESWVFWSLLAEAWLSMLKQAYRNRDSAELKPYVAEIATRALRYAGLVMRWDYHQSRNPAASAWRRVHKIYRLVERDGYATREIQLNARATHCAREYTLVVLMGLVQPLGYRTQEIEFIAGLFEGYEPLSLPATVPQRDTHTHMVDLSLSEGAFTLDNEWVQGRRLRYFALRPLIEHLKSLSLASTKAGEREVVQQVASLIERGGVRRNRHRTYRFGRVWVAAGMDNILSVLTQSDATRDHPSLEPWMLRDESTEGMGFSVADESVQSYGRLVAVTWDPAGSVWQLLTVRWNREEDGQHLVGTQRLSRHPKKVEIYFDPDMPDVTKEKAMAVFLPMSHTETGVSNLLIPRSHYLQGAPLVLRDGNVVYRLRLGEVQETHESWLRVSMDVISREQLAVAA